MDGKTKKASSSSSSLTSELFGSNANPLASSSSSGTFRSIFPPHSKVMGRESMQQSTVTAGWKDKSPKIGDIDRHREKQENLGSVYQQDQKVQPCHLSSSIYYGGPDVYFQSKDSSFNSTENKKEGGEDDTGSASRGNWWKGSLYY
ncbi:SIS protein [Hirschfeldia incana]|nr:SIS protein [Hirschfeldia incana]